MQELRGLLSEQDSSLKVIKKTLIQRALGESPLTDSAEMEGQIALAFGYSDEAAVAKVLANFAKAHPELEIRAALSAEGVLLSQAEVATLASLPSRDQLRA